MAAQVMIATAMSVLDLFNIVFPGFTTRLRMLDAGRGNKGFTPVDTIFTFSCEFEV